MVYTTKKGMFFYELSYLRGKLIGAEKEENIQEAIEAISSLLLEAMNDSNFDSMHGVLIAAYVGLQELRCYNITRSAYVQILDMFKSI